MCRIFTISVLLVGILGCKPSGELPNVSFATGLFFNTTDREWSRGITNITFAKTGANSYVPKDDVLKTSSIVITETNAAKIAELIECFQRKPGTAAGRLITEKTAWRVLIFSSENGWADVRLTKTDVKGVFSATVNSAGTSKLIQNCYQLP